MGFSIEELLEEACQANMILLMLFFFFFFLPVPPKSLAGK